MERISVARKMGIISCIAFQIFMLVYVFNIAGGMEFWAEAIKHLFEGGVVVLVTLALPFLVISIINIMIIRYLVSDKGHSSIKKH